MALAAAVSPLAAANRGGESGLHGDAIFFLCVFAKFLCSLCALSTIDTYLMSVTFSVIINYCYWLGVSIGSCRERR